jgi:hypothetical protein
MQTSLIFHGRNVLNGTALKATGFCLPFVVEIPMVVLLNNGKISAVFRKK